MGTVCVALPESVIISEESRGVALQGFVFAVWHIAGLVEEGEPVMYLLYTLVYLRSGGRTGNNVVIKVQIIVHILRFIRLLRSDACCKDV